MQNLHFIAGKCEIFIWYLTGEMNLNIRKILNRSFVGLGAALAFGVAIYLSVYMFIKNSEAYRYVGGYIFRSEVVNKEFGAVERISLLLDGFYLKSDGSDGVARMKIRIIGKEKEGVAFFYLKQGLYGWEVREFQIL